MSITEALRLLLVQQAWMPVSIIVLGAREGGREVGEE
jgi:hypothetical protein